MARRKKECECPPRCTPRGGCVVEGVVTVDGRGQLVLPKEVRDKSGIRKGDKLVVISCEKGGEVCCLSMVRAEEFAGTVKSMLGPALKEILAT